MSSTVDLEELLRKYQANYTVADDKRSVHVELADQDISEIWIYGELDDLKQVELDGLDTKYFLADDHPDMTHEKTLKILEAMLDKRYKLTKGNKLMRRRPRVELFNEDGEVFFEA